MELIRPFRKLNKDNADLAGGKGASLGEMTQAGIPVPPGFVVLSASFERFLEETDLNIEIDAILHEVNHKEIHTVEGASESIRELILNAEMPKDIADEIDREFKILNTQYVAVRSSATAEDGKDHAWAGQLESYLNTTEDDVLNKVKLCWSSLFTPRAIFYRFEKGLHTTKISVAVVIQKMVESEVSGIAFSVHPVTEDYNQLIIEAGFGLGEAIVSGSVTPDSYVVSKEPRAILDINISTQDRALYRSETVSAEHGRNEWRTISEPKASSQVLSGSQILELSELILKIENHYGFPCDIEWAYEGGKFYVVQSRPITTLSPKIISEDIIPDLKDFTLTFSRPQSVLRDELAYTAFERYSDIPRLRMMTMPLEGTNRAIYADSIFLKQLFETLLGSISTTKGFEEHLKNYVKVKENFNHTIDEILEASSGKEELLRLYKKALMEVVNYGDYVWMPIPIEKILVPQFIERLKDKNPDQWEEINHAVSSPIKLYGYQEMRLAICDAAIENKTNSKETLKNLVDQFKWVGEYAYVEPLCEEDYFKAEFAKLTIEIAEQEKNRILDDIKHNKKNLEKAYSQIKDDTLVLQARIINEYTFLRTDRVDLLKKLQVSVRGILEKVAEYLTKETGKPWTRIKVTNLLNSEIIDYLSGKFIPDLDSVNGRDGAVYYRTRDQIRVIADTATVQKIKNEMNAGADGVIKGMVAFKGSAKGHVKMVFSKADLPKVLPGDILVARTTMPDYTPAMEIASAFVTEEGGVTSHAAIIARELKKPCIVGTGNCTKILKDGDLVEVDADNGVVRILEKTEGNKVQAANSYVGEVDVSDNSTLSRLFTREYSILAFHLWSEDILNHLNEWAGPGVLDNMLILSEGRNNEKAGVYYRNKDLVVAFSNLQKLLNTSSYFYDVEKRFNETLQYVQPAINALKDNPNQKTLKHFLDVFSAWYLANVSVMHSTVDLEGVDESLREKALRYREQTQELDASLSSIAHEALLVMYPHYKDILWYLLPKEVPLLEKGLSEADEQNILRRKNEGWYFLNGAFYTGRNSVRQQLKKHGLCLSKEENVVLSNIYSREKTLFYFTMWNDSDRLGYERFLGYIVKDNLFIVPQSGEKGSVWYSQEELGVIDSILEQKVTDPQFAQEIIETLDSNWAKLKPYLVGGQKFSSTKEFLSYYKALVAWWSAMNTVFTVPDKESAPSDFKQKILAYRTESEKYTEQMNKVFIEYWNESGLEHRDLLSFVTPEEAVRIIEKRISREELVSIEKRRNGCFMYDRVVCPLSELDSFLDVEGLSLEKKEAISTKEIRGTSAMPGKIIGRVKIVKVKTDVTKIREGDVLVTEMTNPDCVPFMKTVSAIVTDEGGMTCHAAIVARELKKPCVIGTKFATRVLKDGDLVEVDADNGVVKIL